MSIPYEVTVLSQKNEGMGLSLGHQMMTSLYQNATAGRIQLVQGRGPSEMWRDVHTLVLDPMMKHFRKSY